VQDGSPSAVAPFVPASVFPGVLPVNYWSATTSAHPNPTTTQFTINNSLIVNFQDGSVETLGKGSGSTAPVAQVWCVRGPMSESVY